MLRTVLLAVLFTSHAVLAAEEESPSWNDAIKWTDYETGLQTAKEEGKPLMLLIHRLWCGACKALRPKFAGSKEIEALSDKFVMVNSHDEKEFNGAPFVPDGGYIPRILFFDSNGKFMEQVKAKRDKNLYFHPNADAVLEVMKLALKENAKVAQEEGDKKEEL